MFKTLYRCARTATRHETGPAAQSRLAYLEHLAAGGATMHCLRANAGVLYRAAACMNLDDTGLAALRRAVAEHVRQLLASIDRRTAVGLGFLNSL